MRKGGRDCRGLEGRKEAGDITTLEVGLYTFGGTHASVEIRWNNGGSHLSQIHHRQPNVTRS